MVGVVVGPAGVVKVEARGVVAVGLGVSGENKLYGAMYPAAEMRDAMRDAGCAEICTGFRYLRKDDAL
jgi:hypothetical protein